jgi:DNA-binding NarL/FixJ family response regulator
MDYLHRRGPFADPAHSPRPGLILLDLNMPKKDGREALREIRADPKLKNIRVVVLTTSQAESDIVSTYNLGASSFISKPVTFDALLEVVKALGKYWLEIVELPCESEGRSHG